ncbi:MAG: HD domain-containing protein [Anaerolineae bacterium]
MKIYDSVHGFIRFNEIESALIDSPAFQRLHYIRQLGMGYLVYPGATHTRFEHSLGVMELASRIFERIFFKLFDKQKNEGEYWKQILRLSALCHDLGHLPFSHTAEKALFSKGKHEEWTLKIICSKQLDIIWQEMQKKFPQKDVVNDLIKMSIGENTLVSLKLKERKLAFSPIEKVLAQVIAGDFFGADRIDYLLRDAKCTGVSYGLFDYHQLIEMLTVIPSSASSLKKLSLGIEEGGIESCEALLLARHFMHKRVYQHAAVKAYSFHLSRFMKTLLSKKESFWTLEGYLATSDNEILAELSSASTNSSHPGHQDAICILQRTKRFKALPIRSNVKEKELLKLITQLSIPKNEIGWELTISKKSKRGLDFSVQKKSGAIVEAALCSEICIPNDSTSWVFLAPSYVSAFQKGFDDLYSSYANECC